MLKDKRGYFLNHHALYRKLGLDPAKHLPVDGFEPRWCDGVLFKCEPELGGKHRIKFMCACSQWIPFGRAGQHMRACGKYPVSHQKAVTL
jgi:hypothetical protein